MESFKSKELLGKNPPIRRAAYSDRTAWLLAEMSQLAYVKFEQNELNFLDLAKDMIGMEKEALADYLQKEFTSLIKNTNELKKLKENLQIADFEVIQTFDKDGTQAFLAKRETDKMVVLSFRGTEVTQLKDIETDLRAITHKNGKTKTHTGFRDAYFLIHDEVKAELEKIDDSYSIYITGHSLGGALALLATKNLHRDNIAACYTYGSPRVGNEEFAYSIKVPIYRVVNTVDIVPRLPPGRGMDIFVDFFRILGLLIKPLNNFANVLDDKLCGYRHHGDMRFLTNCKKSDCSDVQVIYNLPPLARLRRQFKNNLSLKRNISDHSIDKYCKKLAAYAIERLKK